MIAGNPNAGRKLTTVAIVIVVTTLVVMAVLIGLRRETVPVKAPPLHPSTITLKTFQESGLAGTGWPNFPQLGERFCGIRKGSLLRVR